MKRDSERGPRGGRLARQNVTRILLSRQNIKRILLPRFLCISQQYVTCDEDISFHNFQGTIARVPRTMKKDGSITSLTIIYNLGRAIRDSRF